MKIRSKLLAWSLLAVIVPLMVVSFLAFQMAKTEVVNKTAEQISQISTKQKQRINVVLQKRRENVIEFANRYDFGVLWHSLASIKNKTNLNKMHGYLLENMHEYDGLSSLMIVDTAGQIYLSTDNRVEHYFLTSGHEEKISMETVDGELKLVVHYRLMVDNKIAGYIVAFFQADDILAIIHDYSGLGNTGESLLAKRIDGGAFFMTPSRFDVDGGFNREVSSQNKEAPVIVALAKNEVNFQNLFDYRNVSVLGSTRYIDIVDWGLVTKIDTSEIMEPIDNLQQKLILVVMGTIITMSLFVWIWSDFFAAPIIELTEYTKRISIGDLSQKIENNSADEVGDLTRSFNSMVSKLNDSYLELEKKVEDRTQEISSKNSDLERTKMAVINILDDVERAKTDLEKFKLAVEEASDHIVITDSDGIILYANKAVEKITGYNSIEIIGKKAGNKELWGGLMDKNFYGNMWKVIKKDKKIFSGEVNNKRKNGEKYVAIASISPIIGQDGLVQFFVGIERDVTHEKEVDRMKTDFISLASHQLRTPLSAMRWFAEMLLAGDVGKLTKEQSEFVKNIESANARMIVLVNSLLNISRIESGRIVVDPEPTDLKKLVETELLEIDKDIKNKKQTVLVGVDKDLPKINVDPKLIMEVYKNLLTNANKYTPVGGEIEVFISHKDKEVISRISDNGLGIPKAGQDKIFDRFYRAENVLKLETEGTGLGLYLAKAIVESSGGKIWFESNVGKGSTFWFSLPLSGMKKKTGEISINS